MPIEQANRLLIKTPEGVVFSLRLASPLTRCVAWLVDLGCIATLCLAIGTLLGILRLISFDLAAAFVLLGYFGVSIGYGIATEWFWRGQTIGKRLLKLRVMDAEGLRLQFNQIVLRNLLRFVDMLPAFYLVGGMAALLNRRNQRLGDFAANTIVIWNPAREEPDLEKALGGMKYNSLRAYPHLAARLRQRVTPPEAMLALQAIIRREDFNPEARVRLFAQLGSHFRALVEFPADSSEGLSDEQYVRNVVDIVFRAKLQSSPAPAGEPGQKKLEAV
jgi:uncharacterized RDD family membrane protein YckC